ncbi:uncharacterized protein LOC110117940 [Ceratitis capitata]|uniref:uncharacterized protein LOC110117940 n=1 Tax=Ceratitis capitata TaxID=7213 RepID=UPI000A11DFFE|nr:uncharacterized protein LOC110117940 [Ceratitis capitata]
MFSTTNTKIKLPSDSAVPSLRCLLNGSFRDLNFVNTDHRITPVHDVVFLDEVDPTIKPLNYRPIITSSLTVTSERIHKFNGTNGLDTTSNGQLMKGLRVYFWHKIKAL